MSAPVEIPKHLEGVLAKLARAEQHLRTLDDQIKRYLDECHSKISVPIKIDPKLDTIRLYFEPLPEPDLEISMVIGDCIHNARSSLDHLWKRLSGGPNNFPIYGDIDGPNNWNANKIARLTGVDSGAHAIIDGLQPCHYRKDAVLHPLAVLNKLSNLDKHQAIHLTKPHSTNMQFTFRTDSSGIATVIRPPVVFHDNTEVVITGVPKGAVHAGMNVDVKGTLFVALKDSSDWARQPVQEILRRLLDFLQRDVVARLAIFTK